MAEEESLIKANNLYAHVRFRDGRETTVGTKYLAPAGMKVQEVSELCKDNDQNHEISDVKNIQRDTNISKESEVPISSKENFVLDSPSQPVRRSTRVRRPPDRLNL